MMKNPLVNITDNAVNRAKDLLSENKSVVGLRVSVSQGGCSGMTYEVSLSEKINKGDKYFDLNTNAAEGTAEQFVMLSNGFKLRNTATQSNASGGTFIYLAFAENPFVTSTGIPTTAR